MRAVMAALQTLRGIRQVTAATIVSEVGPLSRFPHPRQLMGYTGTVPCEHSSGRMVHRGAITKTGNAHLRRVLVEAAWAYRFAPKCAKGLRQRQRGQPESITALAWKAQQRLCRRYRRLLARGKPTPHVITAVARELVGFIWAIGVAVERQLELAA
jgi:transposase